MTDQSSLSPHELRYELLMQLHVAVKDGDMAAASAALAAGAPLDGEDDAGRTALHCAARRGQLAMLEWLLARGAALDYASHSACGTLGSDGGRSALQMAAMVRRACASVG